MSSWAGRRRTLGAALTGLVLAGALAPTTARAQGAGAAQPAAVAVTLPDCLPPQLQEDVIAALRVELRETTSNVALASDGPPPGAAHLELGPACDPSRLELRVRLGPGLATPNATTPNATTPDAERTIDIQQVPDQGRPRVVAIALAELLRSAIDDPDQAARTRAAPAQAPQAPPGSPTASPPPKPPLVLPRIRILAGAMARATTDPVAAHLGPRLDARLRVLPWLDVALGGGALFAGETTRLGEVDSSAFLARGALSVASRRRSHQIDVGAFVEAGAARIVGTPARGGVVAREANGAVAGVGIAAGGELLALAPLALRAEVEVGAAVAPLRGDADDRPTPGYGGPFVGATLQVGLGF